MSDAALLVRAMRPGPPRALIAVHVLVFFAAIGAIILWVGPSATGGFTRAIFLGAIFGWVPGLIAVLTLMVFFDDRYGPDAYTAELLRRAGWLSASELTDAMRAELAEVPGPGWLLLFHGRALPHGGEHFVRVTLFADDARACPVRYGGLRVTPRLGDSADPRDRVYLGTDRLTPDERDELSELLASGREASHKGQNPASDGDSDGFQTWPGRIADGYPFTLLALRRGPGDSIEVAGNLADPDSPPRPRRVAALMLDIAQRAGAPRSQYGFIERGHLVFSER